MSQAVLSEKADVAIATIGKIEANDGYTPSGKTMLKLAAALSLDVSQLFWSEEAGRASERVEAAS